jgi:asparagine synthase (glutamine-hydrolysing)
VCGICGVATVTGRVEPGLVGRMTATMSHRGPDDEGLWSSADGRVALGHRRLSIIDLSSGGHQPMLDASGLLSVSFNGEIYNFRELRKELANLGHSFRTESDTEVILAAYREWGLDSFTHLNGMFALAIYDAERERLVLARDRAGEKPLFYRHSAGALHFTSELKAFLREADFEPRIDHDALNRYLAFGYIPGEQSIIRGVRKLPQGSLATFDLRSDRLEVYPYWTLPAPMGSATTRPEELVEELERLLLDSVRLRLIADVPVGVMLSGGVDSSLVTAAAATVSPRPVRTFNISFPGHGMFDESAHARIVARHFGTEHIEMAAEPASVDLLPELARQYDEPLADSSMIPTYLVSRLIRREATVALGGDGGDELFGGYHHYEWVRRQDLIRRAVPAPLRGLISSAARHLPPGWRGRNYLVGTAKDIDWSMASANLYFDLDARRKLLEPRGVRASDRVELEKAELALGNTAVQRSMAMDFRSYLVDDILTKVDRASMLTSLEVRAPLLDPRIIEFAFGRVPDHLRAWKGRRKILLKMLGAKILPPELDMTRKQGFSIPLDHWFRAGKWGSVMKETLAASEVFGQQAVDELIKSQERGASNAHRIFALVMFELWRREYGVSL